MLLNIVFLFLLFGTRKKLNPYISAAIFGAIKSLFYLLGTKSVIAAAVVFLVCGGLAATMVYLLARIDRQEAAEQPDIPVYTTRRRSGKFKWEYIPLTAIVMFLIGGEMVIRWQ